MDELVRLTLRILTAASILCGGGCTFRERVAYEDCVRAQCDGEGIRCTSVEVIVEPTPRSIRICTKSCESDADCPPDPGTALPGRCVELESTDKRCLPSCETEYDCAIPLRCDVDEGVCLPELF